MITISTALNEYRLQGVMAFLAQGSEGARAEVYDGVRPVLGGAPLGKLLVAIILADPVGTVAEGVLTLTPTAEVMITATGQATWARTVNGEGAVAWDCDVSELNGTGELRLPSTTLYAGGFTRIVSGVIA
ncbi:hypothetical protein EWI61_13755 [Methylolobus aquaticus]|nr:hypothetical protein EWI61_13755 [Methylolobus aquaticus]